MSADEAMFIGDLVPIEFYPYATLVTTRGIYRQFKRHKSLRLARSAVTNGKEQRRAGQHVFAIYEWQGDMETGGWIELEEGH